MSGNFLLNGNAPLTSETSYAPSECHAVAHNRLKNVIVVLVARTPKPGENNNFVLNRKFSRHIQIQHMIFLSGVNPFSMIRGTVLCPVLHLDF